MSTVTVSQDLPVPLPVAEAAWYDPGRWASWVDGLEVVEEVSPQWPAGGAVRWHSGPAGRGRVQETVLHHEPGQGQTLQVSDDSLDGRQSVSFTAAGEEGVTVRLTLNYKIRAHSLVTPLVDVLFIRRAMRDSMRGTLRRFGGELAVPPAGPAPA
ncbi:MAG: SRPBCC family protein [Actinomycetota bacterium]|nr:SRPBCC family protein [Actinomycetota bacterium]